MKKMFDTIQIVVGFVSFIAMLGFVGACEHGGSLSEYAIKAFIALAVLSADAIIYHERHKEEEEYYFDE